MASVNETTQINSLETTTGISVITMSAGGLDPDFFIEGANSYSSDLDIEIGYIVYTLPTNIDVTGTGTTYQNMKNVWWYALGLLPSFLDTWQNGGIGLRVYDGSGNYSEWYCGGNDNYVGGWKRWGINLDTTPDAISGTLILTDINRFEFRFKGIGKSKLSQNIFLDDIRLGTVDEGVQIDGGTSGTPYTFDDLVTQDDAVIAGMIRKTDGVYFINGPMTVGNITTGDTYFLDTLKSIRTEDTYRTFTTANRGTAESYRSTTHYKLNVVGASGSITSFILGAKSGVRGIQGISFSTGGIDCNLQLDASDTDNDTFELYGSTFQGLGVLTCPTVSATRETIDCSFIASNEINPSTMKFQYCSIIDALDRGILMSSATHNLTDISYINNPHGIHFDTIITITLQNHVFSGSNGTTLYDAENSSTGLVAVIATGTTNISNTYIDNSGVGSSSSVSNNKTLTLTGLIADSEVRILDSSKTILDGIENSTTTFDYIYNYIPATTITIVILHIDYVYERFPYLLLASDAQLPIQQSSDRNYSNP